MNDETQPSASDKYTSAAETPEDAGTPAPSAEAKTSPVRLIVLLLILAVAGFALYWDRQIARPESEDRVEKLEQAVIERNSTAAALQLSPEEVAEVIGREASPVRETEKWSMERYRWPAGLPWKSYDIYVVYIKTSDGPRFHTYSYMNEPEEEAMPGYVLPADPDAWPDDDELESGEGGPAEGGPGEGGPSEGGGRPESE